MSIERDGRRLLMLRVETFLRDVWWGFEERDGISYRENLFFLGNNFEIPRI